MFSVMAHFLQILQIRSIFDPAFLDACSYPDSIDKKQTTGNGRFALLNSQTTMEWGYGRSATLRRCDQRHSDTHSTGPAMLP
jgi:hypothetical protein